MATTPSGAPPAPGAVRRRRSVCILYTGGTMGMMHDAATNALRPVANHLSEQLQELAEFRKPDMPDYTIIEYDPLLDSASMTPDGASFAKTMEGGWAGERRAGERRRKTFAKTMTGAGRRQESWRGRAGDEAYGQRASSRTKRAALLLPLS